MKKEEINLKDLSLADLGYVMSQLSKEMSKIDKGAPQPDNKKWEEIAYKRSQVAWEVTDRMNRIKYLPKP